MVAVTELLDHLDVVRLLDAAFAGRLARAAHAAGIGFAIGAERVAPLWRTGRPVVSGIAVPHQTVSDGDTRDSARIAVPVARVRHLEQRGRVLAGATQRLLSCPVARGGRPRRMAA